MTVENSSALPQQRGEATSGTTDDAVAAPGPRQSSARPTRTVLVVDDVPETRELMRWQLSGEDDLMVVGEAGDGDAAISEAVRLRPDVVVLDLLMPVRGGLETIDHLRRLCPGSAVVAITSYDSLENRNTALDRGASCYIVKGTRRAEFIKRVREAVNNPT